MGAACIFATGCTKDSDSDNTTTTTTNNDSSQTPESLTGTTWRHSDTEGSTKLVFSSSTRVVYIDTWSGGSDETEGTYTYSDGRGVMTFEDLGKDEDNYEQFQFTVNGNSLTMIFDEDYSMVFTRVQSDTKSHVISNI
jgi:hypothetical protein